MIKHFINFFLILIIGLFLSYSSDIRTTLAVFTTSIQVNNNLVTTGVWPSPTPTPGIIVNHQSVSGFSTIPDSNVTTASALRLMLRRASVGGNISGGLDDLYTQNSKYNRSAWQFQDRGNPGWQAKVDDLVTQTAAQLSNFDVFSMKFCYIDPDANWDYYRSHMEQLMNDNPTKKFVWITIPLTTSGNANTDAFNANLRNYAQTHNIFLFDLAAIESHDPSGNPVTNGSSEALYAGYTSDGGHLNTTGADRVAQAWWYLMARVSGWDGTPAPTPTPTPTPDPNAANLSFDPTLSTATVGQNVIFNFNISNAKDLGVFEAKLTYNPAVVEFVSYSLGSFLGSTGRSTGPLGPVVNTTLGTVTFGGFSMGTSPLGPSGNGTLGILTFKGKATGQNSLTLSNISIGSRTNISQPIGQVTGGTIIIQ